jgi:hypothetical protein
MALKVRCIIEGSIEITDEEAEILHHLLCYDLVDYFTMKCSKRFTPDFIREKLKRLRHEMEKIEKAKKTALDALFPTKE